MFTGLIERTGRVGKIVKRGNYRVLTVEPSGAFDSPLVLGESVACDGACLTVVSLTNDSFVVEVSQETVERTLARGYKTGSLINLERAMKLGERLGGHLVSGHVDEVGTADYLRPVGESLELAVKFSSDNDHLVIEKGSIAINGVSLTVNAVRSGWLSVNLIPHTASQTTIGVVKPGDKVNLEYDMIGKYVTKMLGEKESGTLTAEKLKEYGW